MPNYFSTVIALFIPLLPAGSGFVGGGDPFDIYLVRGRQFALDVLNAIEPSHFERTLSSEEIEWLFANRTTLREDVRATRWIESDKPLTLVKNSCGLTEFNKPKADVIYDRQFCKNEGVIDVEVAAKMMIHESIHHLQVVESQAQVDQKEQQAQLIAHSVIEAGKRLPQYNRVVEVFDSSDEINRHGGFSTPLVWTYNSEKQTQTIYGSIAEPHKTSIWTNPIETGFFSFSTDHLESGWSQALSSDHPRDLAFDYPASRPLLWSGDLKNKKTRQWLLKWGDCYHPHCRQVRNKGFLYNIESGHSLFTPTLNEPAGRMFHTATMLGERALIWGGLRREGMRFDVFSDGALFDFEKLQWLTLSPSATRPQERFGHTSVSTGNSVLIWGGCNDTQDKEQYACLVPLCNGSQLNAETLEWTAIPRPHFDIGCIRHRSVWTGSRMIVWGGETQRGVPAKSGGIYDPVLRTWEEIPPHASIQPRIDHHMLWTGSELVVVGGMQSNAYYQQLPIIIFNPATAQWRSFVPVEIPRFLDIHAVWTGLELVLAASIKTSSNPFNHESVTRTFVVNLNAQ